jgi:hypothetical protein
MIGLKRANRQLPDERGFFIQTTKKPTPITFLFLGYTGPHAIIALTYALAASSPHL